MDAVLSVLCFFSYALVKVYSVPPDICYEQFKWQDCGMDPKPVIYYYKSGSRCEVGMWRGCLPNNNMFEDEYDCVQTCIFSLRAKPIDYHKQQEENLIEHYETTTKAKAEKINGGIGDIIEIGDGGGGGADDKGGEDTPADAAAEEGEAAVEGGGDAPADDAEAHAEGADAPADGEAPAEGEAPADGEEPADGNAPAADGEAPVADGEAPAEEPAPAE